MFDSMALALLFPLAGALVNGLLGKRLSRVLIGIIASGAVLASFVVTLLCFLKMRGLAAAESVQQVKLFTWIEAGGFVSDFGLLIDPLSVVMMLIVSGVGFLIHVYSIEYMAGEEGCYRYFSYLNLFILMMSVLVLADNYLMMFVGWEGVGLCSYLLIGFYIKKRSAGDAAKKAFIVNRIGDFGFLLGIFWIFSIFGSIDYLTVFEGAAAGTGAAALVGITLLLFVGAVGKSAQIPLYVWLPDAMEGPTPVSALIHAATMVTAGVYMIARSAALYSRAPETLALVAGIGIATALLAAVIAVAQTDIKKVLAYSTVSQLGYMFVAVGVGAFGAGVFHLTTHAFFKALLFLGSGSVILAMHHQQEMDKMGGLKKYLPRTYWTMLIAAAAIAGVPLLSGFFSKDEILWKAFSSPLGSPVLWCLGVLVAGLTAFYMFRLIFLTFHGPERIEFPGGHGGHHQADGHHSRTPHEPSGLVTVPLAVLAVLSALGGLIGLPAWTGLSNRLEHFLEPSFHHRLELESAHHSHSLEIFLAGVTVVAAAVGIGLAYHAYLRRPGFPERLAERFSGLYSLVRNKFYVDEIYDSLVVHPLERFSRQGLWRAVDDGIVDGAVNGTASLALRVSQRLRRLQTGQVRVYASWILGGGVVMLVYYLLGN